MKKSILICLWLICGVGVAIGSQIPAKEDLVSFYEKSISMPDKISFTVTNEPSVEGIEQDHNEIQQFTVCQDKSRRVTKGSSRITRKGSGKVKDESYAFYMDRRCVISSWSSKQPLRIYVSSEKNRAVAERQFYATWGGAMVIVGKMSGIDIDENRAGSKRLSDFLREYTDLKVRDSMELIDGHSTYVLDGRNNQGRIVVWLDPNAGFCPRKIELYKTGEDILYGKPVTSYQEVRPEFAGKKMKEFTVVVDSIKIDNINDVFFITSGRLSETRIYDNSQKFVLSLKFNISDINLNPDFDASRPFDIKAPDGTPVYDEDFPGGRFEVHQGKVVSAGTSFNEIDKTIEQIKQQ